MPGAVENSDAVPSAFASAGPEEALPGSALADGDAHGGEAAGAVNSVVGARVGAVDASVDVAALEHHAQEEAGSAWLVRLVIASDHVETIGGARSDS